MQSASASLLCRIDRQRRSCRQRVAISSIATARLREGGFGLAMEEGVGGWKFVMERHGRRFRREEPLSYCRCRGGLAVVILLCC